MPYGIDKDLGGDNKPNLDFMERCVKSVMDSGKAKPSAIAICKAQLRKKHEKNAEIKFDRLDLDIIAKEFNYRWACIKKFQREGKTYEQALSQYEAHLAKNNYIIK